jgi:hypothetical protein
MAIAAEHQAQHQARTSKESARATKDETARESEQEAADESEQQPAVESMEPAPESPSEQT